MGLAGGGWAAGGGLGAKCKERGGGWGWTRCESGRLEKPDWAFASATATNVPRAVKVEKIKVGQLSGKDKLRSYSRSRAESG